MEVIFRLGRSDAEQAVALIGRIDPHAVKHELRPGAPTYYSAAEQRQLWAQAIADLPPRHAVIRLPDGKVVQIRTIAVPDPPVNEARFRAVAERYLARDFRPRAMVEKEATTTGQVSAPHATTRLRLINDDAEQ